MKYIISFMFIVLYTPSIFCITLYEDSMLVVTGDSAFIPFKNIIKKHMRLNYKIIRWKPECKTVMDALAKKESKRHCKVRSFLGNIEYSLPSVITLINNKSKCVSKVIYLCNKNEQTKEEIEEYKKSGEIPSGFKKYNQLEALEIAQDFLGKILKEYDTAQKATDYDSVFVTEHEWDYVVYLRGKPKNDIADGRFAKILVSPKTGTVSWFNGDIRKRHGFDYVPKVKKQQALEKFYELMQGDSILSYSIKLDKCSRSDYKWGWNIFADPVKGKRQWVIIDSENGEVLYNLWGK